MDAFSSYQNGSQIKEQDFEKLSQTIGTSIQKISQNGVSLFVFKFLLNLIFPILVSSMQRMVNQIGTHQDSPELRKQL